MSSGLNSDKTEKFKYKECYWIGMVDVKEGFIKDLATGKILDGKKPEEKVRQEYEKILYEDYDYDYNQMDIEVAIQRGEKSSKKNKSERADIVIYNTANVNNRDQNKDTLGIVETKSPTTTRKEGVKQLMSYMSATSCSWGVWTNGKEIEYVYRDLKTGEIKRDFVYQIPKKGETFEEIGRISKKNLKPARNLKIIFYRMLNTLYANTNISRREKLGNEMIRLLFCKIWDERYDINSIPKFRIGFNESPEDVKQRIDELFEDVKKELVDDGVFDENEEIKLDAKSIAYVVGELEQFSLTKTDKDTVGDAFEVFAESKFAGEKGEFFTPREIVKTAIKIINPEPNDKIFDPACGSGGFLIYALEHVWTIMKEMKKYRDSPDFENIKKRIAESCFFGIDKEIDLVKIAKAYMAIVGDGRGGIVQQNTLHQPEDYEGKAKDLFVKNKKFKEFDIILTNPPFGSKIKVLEEDSKYYDLGHIWKKVNDVWEKTQISRDTEPQLLFIERCFSFLRQGGKLAIVLPETYFHAPNSKYVLEYIKKDNNIIAIIDLAHNTFRPHNNAKTLLLVLEKGVKQGKDIIMGVAEEIGHDHTGRPMFRYDYATQKFTNEIWDDTKIIREELDNPSNPQNKNVFVINTNDIKNDVFVPRYYWDKRIKNILKAGEKQNLEFVQVKELIKKGIISHFYGHGSPEGRYKGKGEIPYIRVKDIVNWEVYKDNTAMIPKHVYLSKKGKNSVNLQENDVLFVRRGSYRIGTVAMVSPFDKEVLLTREISVFRVENENNEYDINPFYLTYLFSHNLTQQQLYNKVLIDTTLPTIGNRWSELYLPISKDKKQRKKIADKIRETFTQKWEAQRRINSLKEEFGNIVT